jgi:hypothetical protein
MTRNAEVRARRVELRNDVVIEDPGGVALELLQGQWHLGFDDPVRRASFDDTDVRRANRGGARISAAEADAIRDRRTAIERALRTIHREASLAGPAAAVPWAPLGRLFEGFADIRGVGLAKTTKALHGKRPALIPILDSVVQAYLADDDPGERAPFAERGLELVRAYKRDLDRNRAALRAVRSELARRGYEVAEVRILDVLIWSAAPAS